MVPSALLPWHAPQAAHSVAPKQHEKLCCCKSHFSSSSATPSHLSSNSSKRLARFTSVHRLHCQPEAGAGSGFEARVGIVLDTVAPEHACSFADTGLHALFISASALANLRTARSSSKRCFKQTFWWQRPQTTWQQNLQANAACFMPSKQVTPRHTVAGAENLSTSGNRTSCLQGRAGGKGHDSHPL